MEESTFSTTLPESLGSMGSDVSSLMKPGQLVSSIKADKQDSSNEDEVDDYNVVRNGTGGCKQSI